jgi:hypothetical protein
MRTNDILFLLALADAAFLGYIHLRHSRRLRVERVVRSLRRALVLAQVS